MAAGERGGLLRPALKENQPQPRPTLSSTQNCIMVIGFVAN